MPTSDKWGKATVKEWIRTLVETRRDRGLPFILTDIGPGEGTYADLTADIPGIERTAIEVWGPYVEKYGLEEKYNRVIVSDARYVDPVWLGGDLVIFGDVAEHMEKKEFQRILYLCQEYAGHALVAFPVLHLEFGAYEGNPFDAHKMENHWTYLEMVEELKNHGEIIEALLGSVVAYILVKFP